MNDLHPIVASTVSLRMAEASEASRPGFESRVNAVRDRMLALKADRDASGRWDFEALIQVVADMQAAGKDMADIMMAAGWPTVAAMIIPEAHAVAHTRMRQAMQAKAEEAVAKWCGGWTPQRMREALAEAEAYDRDTAAQTDAVLADIFKEEGPNHAH